MQRTLAMFDAPAILTASRRAVVAIVLAGGFLAAASADSIAQQVLMVVNGDPITTFDVEQRTRFLQLASNKTPPRQEVIDELISEKIKLQLPRRFDFSGTNLDGDVENAIANMARRAHKSKQQFLQDLEKTGVLSGTLKSRIKAEIIWTQVIRGKFQSSLQFNEQEILKEVETGKKDERTAYDYSLRPIVFVVARGSPQAALEARRREADALRGRFENCQSGIPFARALHGIVVREQITRSSADLPAQLREILDKTEVGKLTPPEVTMQGIELYALCSKKESSVDNTPAKREAREKLYSDNFKAKADKYLKELRAQAYIVNK